MAADYCVLHQANMKMNEAIVKKLKIGEEKAPSSMSHFGNTSSASIPLTIVTQLKNKIENKKTKFICCGFGVGLSWGTVAFETDSVVISDLVEVKEEA
jgi:3-oxoacyl-[acyl-carrier-protein] synthase-3